MGNETEILSQAQVSVVQESMNHLNNHEVYELGLDLAVTKNPNKLWLKQIVAYISHESRNLEIGSAGICLGAGRSAVLLTSSQLANALVVASILSPYSKLGSMEWSKGEIGVKAECLS